MPDSKPTSSRTKPPGTRKNNTPDSASQEHANTSSTNDFPPVPSDDPHIMSIGPDDIKAHQEGNDISPINEIRDSVMFKLEQAATQYADARVAQEREKLEKTRARLKERTKQAEQRRQQFTKKLKSLDGHRLQVQRKEKAIAQDHAELEEQKKNLRDSKAELKKSTATLQAREIAIEEQNNRLDERIKQADAHHQTLDSKIAEFEQIKRRANQLDIEKSELNQLAASLDSRLARIKQTEKDTAQLHQRAAANATENQTLADQLSEQQKTLDEHRQAIAKQSADLEQREAALATQKNEITSHDSAVASQRGALEKQLAQADVEAEKLAAQRDALQERDQENKNLKDNLEALEQSLSEQQEQQTARAAKQKDEQAAIEVALKQQASCEQSQHLQNEALEARRAELFEMQLQLDQQDEMLQNERAKLKDNNDKADRREASITAEKLSLQDESDQLLHAQEKLDKRKTEIDLRFDTLDLVLEGEEAFEGKIADAYDRLKRKKQKLRDADHQYEKKRRKLKAQYAAIKIREERLSQSRKALADRLNKHRQQRDQPLIKSHDQQHEESTNEVGGGTRATTPDVNTNSDDGECVGIAAKTKPLLNLENASQLENDSTRSRMDDARPTAAPIIAQTLHTLASKATVVACLCTMTIAIIAACCFGIAFAKIKPTFRATVDLTTPPDSKASTSLTNLSDRTLNNAIAQLAIRGLKPFANPTDMRAQLATAGTIEKSQETDQHTITYDDTNRQRAIYIVEAIAKAQIATSKSKATSTPVQIVHAAAAPIDPIRDQRFATGLTWFFIVAAGFGLLITTISIISYLAKPAAKLAKS